MEPDILELVGYILSEQYVLHVSLKSSSYASVYCGNINREIKFTTKKNRKLVYRCSKNNFKKSFSIY